MTTAAERGGVFSVPEAGCASGRSGVATKFTVQLTKFDGTTATISNQ